MRSARLGFVVLCLLVLVWLLLGPEREPAKELVAAPPSASSDQGSRPRPEAGFDAASAGLRREAMASSEGGDSTVDGSPAPTDRLELGSIQGCLYDHAGAPMPKAELWLAPPGSDAMTRANHAYTKGDGCFLFKDVAPGDWWICWRPKGSETSTRIATATVRGGRREIVTIMLEGGRRVSGRITMGPGWSMDMDGGVVDLELSPAMGPDAGKPVAKGVAVTRNSEPEVSGTFQLVGLRPDVYVLKATPFVEGDHLAIEVDLVAGDVALEPIVIGPATPLLPPR